MAGPTEDQGDSAAILANDDLTHRSSLVEKVIEYRFLAALTTELVTRGWDFEVLRSDVDCGGHDLVVEAKGVLRHIQLKGLAAGGKRSRIPVNVALAAKPSPCVVWMTYDPATLDFRTFRWFGGLPGHPMPDTGDRVARHTRANSLGIKAERARHRILSSGQFVTVPTIGELTDRLFGFADEPEALRRHIADHATMSADGWLGEVARGNLAAIPEDLDWDGSCGLAHLIDGYGLLGMRRIEDADSWSRSMNDAAQRTGRWSGGPVELWIALFIEHRRWRMASPYEPEGEQKAVLDALVRDLRCSLR
ncbi:hypothetical protein B0I00_3395 [Novosphingobium kunmingense]|uniref:DUF4365 domain-containing protein n=1 Tax=Novosphingobium kunmingense TaxID=1211806 RepID=A0A2N0H333_9SPHN|nr:hypothetical protein [Novosphingobium kunmingense]PKB13356.1 hypothetical protein B0I00_3395 [Novosphingobium kunmingense]